MRSWKYGKRWLSGLLTFLLFFGTFPSIGIVNAAEATLQHYVYADTDITPDVWRDDDIITPEESYAPDEIVRVSIQLKKDGTVDAGFPVATISTERSAISYRKTL